MLDSTHVVEMIYPWLPSQRTYKILPVLLKYMLWSIKNIKKNCIFENKSDHETSTMKMEHLFKVHVCCNCIGLYVKTSNILYLVCLESMIAFFFSTCIKSEATLIHRRHCVSIHF